MAQQSWRRQQFNNFPTSAILVGISLAKSSKKGWVCWAFVELFVSIGDRPNESLPNRISRDSFVRTRLLDHTDHLSFTTAVFNSSLHLGADDVIQPFSKKSRTPTVAKEFQIGLYDPAEADLEHFSNCCSEGFLGERLYRSTFRGGGQALQGPTSWQGAGCEKMSLP